FQVPNFAATGNLGTGRSSHTTTVLPNGLVLLAGGISGTFFQSSAELYNPVTGTFTPTGSMSTARESHTATLLPSGLVLITGGNSGFGLGAILNSAELYDPATGTFTLLPSTMTTVRNQHTATLLGNGKVLITGGGVGATFTSSAEL